MANPDPRSLIPDPSGDDGHRAAVAVVATLRDAGFVAYLAGGCVRDRLLGRTPKDYDVATDATPAEVKRLFPRSRAVGEAFGVMLVYPPRPRNLPRNRPAAGPSPITQRPPPTEVATFRTDGHYADGRRPETVQFTDARHDAERRDFTVNALFKDPLHPVRFNPDADADGVIDYVGGRADLAAGVLRAVGDPGRRFEEDHLRMLRAVRFAARLGFAIETHTAAAVRAAARHLGQISRERIGQEVQAMLTHPSRAAAVTLLESLTLDGPTLNEDHTAGERPTLAALNPAAGYGTALAAWMLDRHPDGAAGAFTPLLRRVPRWRSALSLSNDDRDRLARVLRHLAAAAGWDALDTAGRKRLASAPDSDQALLLLEARGDAESIRRDIAALATDGIGLDPDPLLTGDDLIRLGHRPGPALGRLLHDLRDAQLDGRLPDRDAAIDWARRHLNPSKASRSSKQRAALPRTLCCTTP